MCGFTQRQKKLYHYASRINDKFDSMDLDDKEKYESMKTFIGYLTMLNETRKRANDNKCIDCQLRDIDDVEL